MNDSLFVHGKNRHYVSWFEAAEIQRRHAAGESLRALVAATGRGDQTVRKIVKRGSRWRPVEGTACPAGVKLIDADRVNDHRGRRFDDGEAALVDHTINSMCAAGASDAEIARAVCVSKATVRRRQDELGWLSIRMAQRAELRANVVVDEAAIARLLADGKTVAEICEVTRWSRNAVERVARPLRLRLMRAGAEALGFMVQSEDTPER